MVASAGLLVFFCRGKPVRARFSAFRTIVPAAQQTAGEIFDEFRFFVFFGSVDEVNFSKRTAV